MKRSTIHKVVTPVGLIIFLLLFLLITSPNHLPLPLIMVPFVVIFMLLFYILRQFGSNSPNTHRRKSLIRAGVLASIPVLLLVLQTIHQLTIKDVLITAGLVLLVTYYLNKADFL